MGIQCLFHIGRMNFHLDCFFCHGLVAGVTVESILSRLQTCQEETAWLVNKYWNSFLADHSLFLWDKNHGRILENKSQLTTSMALLKGPVPLSTTAHVCSQTGAITGCVQLPGSSWDDCWDKGPNVSGYHQPRCTLAAARQLIRQRILGEHFGLRRASLVKFNCYLHLGTTEWGNGFW